jgi:hypothetical protein
MVEDAGYSALLTHTLRLPIKNQKDNPPPGSNKGKFLGRTLYIPRTFTAVDRFPGESEMRRLVGDAV